MIRLRWLLLPLLLAAAGALAVACGSAVSEDDFEALQAQVASLEDELAASREAAVRAQIMTAAATAFAGSSFHSIDEAINDDGEIPATAPGVVSRAQAAIQNVAWPEALQPNIDQLDAELADLAAALDEDNAEAAGEHATRVHDMIHSLEHAIAAYLADEEVPAPPDLEAGDRHAPDEGENHAAEEGSADADGDTSE